MRSRLANQSRDVKHQRHEVELHQWTDGEVDLFLKINSDSLDDYCPE